MFLEPSETEKRENPEWLVEQAEALLSGQTDAVANAANLSALLFLSLKDVNWAGFYFLKGGSLVVGPFPGRPACVEIPLDRGVCGAAAKTGKVQRVADVHSFEGHIACDAASRSEIVLPLFRHGELLGVLDVDSPVPDRFGPAEEQLLKKIADVYVRSLDA